MAPGVAIVEATGPAQVAACRALFEDYRRGLGVSLDFQDFDREVAGLPGAYARPRGRLLLALREGVPIGCAALRRLGPGVAEMKRLYVANAARGTGLGEALARRIVEAAREAGYREVKLDTLAGMAAAQALYARLGFRDCAPYNDNPLPGTRFLALALD